MTTSSSLLKTLFSDKTSWRFVWGALLGFALSISIILCTVGIMDGYLSTLKQGLKDIDGDLQVLSYDGFFEVSERMNDHFLDLGTKEFSGIIQTEGFLIYDEISKGVLVKGIESKSFSLVTGLDIELNNDEVAIGKELALSLDISINDEIVLAFANGNKDFSGLPLLERYKVKLIVEHKVYQKDIRQVYMERGALQGALSLSNKVNSVLINAPRFAKGREQDDSRLQEIKDFRIALYERLDGMYRIRPYWREYSSLIEAVKVEKFMISLILQLIVIIAIFNVLAFVIFVNEKRSQEIFLFKALGMSQKYLLKAWFQLIFFLWFFACGLSLIFVSLFDCALQNLAIFKLPGDVYNLERVSISLNPNDYILVFSLSLLWLIIISWIGLRKVSKQSVLQGLRKEFA